jgi:ankyrin repeat protein
MFSVHTLKTLGSIVAGSALVVGLSTLATPGSPGSGLQAQSLLSVTPESTMKAPLPLIQQSRRAGPAPENKTFTPSLIPAAPVVKKAELPALPKAPEAKQEQAGPPAPEGLLAELAAAAKPLVLNPLPEPAYEPFKDTLESYFRQKIVGADALPPVYLAALQGDAKLLRTLLSSGQPAELETPGGDTPLCAAVWHGHQEVVDLLLSYGADAEKVGREKQPPLALASLRRNTEIMKALLVVGADANCRFSCPPPKCVTEAVLTRDLRSSLISDKGVTPLIACSARGDVEAATLLMRHGAKANLPTTKEYRYPINFAATQGYLFLMRVLLGRSPDVEPNLLVTVDLSKQKAWITRDGAVIDTTSISSGRAGFATPQGRYLVTDKHRSWTSNIYHVAMPYFMRLNCSAIGLHQGHVTGRPASHGCIRLPADKARSFFAKVQVGDEVQIIR